MFYSLADAYLGAWIATYGEGTVADDSTRPGVELALPTYAADERMAFLLTDEQLMRWFEGAAV